MGQWLCRKIEAVKNLVQFAQHDDDDDDDDILQ